MGLDPSKLPERYRSKIDTPKTLPLKPRAASASYSLAVVMMGKPRMTRRDKWQKRPNVVRYRALADEIRAQIPKEALHGVLGLDIEVFFPMPKIWSEEKQAAFAGKLHQSTPDYDNVAKAGGDILFEDDRALAFGRTIKYWDDGQGPRVIFTFHYEHPAHAGVDPANYRGSRARKQARAAGGVCRQRGKRTGSDRGAAARKRV